MYNSSGCAKRSHIMKKPNNNSGFTLLEIIIVLIVLGIVAAIALPNLFGNVTKSRSAEAVNAIESLRIQVEGCITYHPGSENCRV